MEKIKALEVRLCNLPDTPFWVGDIVKKDVGRQMSVRDGVIATVNYNYTTINYRVTTSLDTPSQTELWEEAGLTLVERGNIWKLEHDEPLTFTGETEEARLLEEAKFYKSLGMSQKVRHFSHHVGDEPEAGDLWELRAGIQKLQSGEADQLIVKNKKTQAVILIKYDNEEFGNRMRAAELKRLGFEVEKSILGSGVKRV